MDEFQAAQYYSSIVEGIAPFLIYGAYFIASILFVNSNLGKKKITIPIVMIGILYALNLFFVLILVLDAIFKKRKLIKSIYYYRLPVFMISLPFLTVWFIYSFI